MRSEGKPTWDGIDRIDYGPEIPLTPEQLASLQTPEFVAAIESLHICRIDEGLGMNAEDIKPGIMKEVQSIIYHIPFKPMENNK